MTRRVFLRLSGVIVAGLGGSAVVAGIPAACAMPVMRGGGVPADVRYEEYGNVMFVSRLPQGNLLAHVSQAMADDLHKARMVLLKRGVVLHDIKVQVDGPVWISPLRQGYTVSWHALGRPKKVASAL